LGFSRNLYSLIDNVYPFNLIFPSFRHFLFIGALCLIPFCVFFGYTWVKSPFWEEERRAPAENNPFAYQLAPGRDSILYFGQVIGQKNMLRIFKMHGTITEEEEKRYLEYIELMDRLEKGETIKNE
jgi:hypothetical protein